MSFNICFHVFRTLARRWKRRLRTKNLRAADWILTSSRVRSLGEFTSSVKLQPFGYRFKLREKHRGRMRKDVGDQMDGWKMPSHDVWSCITLSKRCSVMLNHSSSDCCQSVLGQAYHSLKLLATKSVATPNALDGRGCLDEPRCQVRMKVQWTKRCQHVSKILVQLSWRDCSTSFSIISIQAKNGKWKKGEGKDYFRLQPSIWRYEVLKLLPPLCAARSVGPQVKFKQLWLGDQDVTRFHGFHAEYLALFLHSTPRTSLRDVAKYWSK